MPKEAANLALHSAGFASVFPALSPDDDALRPVRDAVERLLRNHAPYPAFAVDRWWNVTRRE
ncbi:MAG: hypothetical protein R3C58_08180 [Parvularculaceae bacterium]